MGLGYVKTPRCAIMLRWSASKVLDARLTGIVSSASSLFLSPFHRDVGGQDCAQPRDQCFQQRSGLQNAIEKRCIVCRWFVVFQFLAVRRRSMSKLAGFAAFTCPAAIGERPGFAATGLLLGRSPYVVQQTGKP